MEINGKRLMDHLNALGTIGIRGRRTPHPSGGQRHQQTGP